MRDDGSSRSSRVSVTSNQIWLFAFCVRDFPPLGCDRVNGGTGVPFKSRTGTGEGFMRSGGHTHTQYWMNEKKSSTSTMNVKLFSCLICSCAAGRPAILARSQRCTSGAGSVRPLWLLPVSIHNHISEWNNNLNLYLYIYNIYSL